LFGVLIKIHAYIILNIIYIHSLTDEQNATKDDARKNKDNKGNNEENEEKDPIVEITSAKHKRAHGYAAKLRETMLPRSQQIIPDLFKTHLQDKQQRGSCGICSRQTV
jgi:hypothetical protein